MWPVTFELVSLVKRLIHPLLNVSRCSIPMVPWIFLLFSFIRSSVIHILFLHISHTQSLNSSSINVEVTVVVFLWLQIRESALVFTCWGSCKIRLIIIRDRILRNLNRFLAQTDTSASYCTDPLALRLRHSSRICSFWVQGKRVRRDIVFGAVENFSVHHGSLPERIVHAALGSEVQYTKPVN